MRFESEQAAATRPQKHIHLSLTARTPTIRQPSEVELELAPPQRKWACVCMKIPCNFLSWRLARFTSNSLSVIHTVTRIVMTLVPMTLIKLRFMSAVLKKLPDDPRVIAHKDSFLRNIKCTKKSLLVMVAIPFALFWTTILSSLERTPLTGRPRLILLSPSEEDDVAKQLQGPGWYSAVADILVNNAEGDVPRVISTTDWRYIWVHDTLRKLETYMHILAHEKEHFQHLVDTAPPGFPVPPPSSYPLAPRPRVSQIVHCFLTETFSRNTPAEPPPALGPPYNLLLVEKPDTSNGFSYGFGAGSAGIVVFSGFLDEILRGSQSPTPEQTAQLAILLAHEISHLILSHHLETLSSSTIFAPNMYNIFSDVVRTLLFPITMMFGPFVNDAVANMTRVTQSELLQGHESCFNRRLEIEADLVSIRILAYAGFDPRLAIHFWESRLDNDHEDLHNHNHNTRAPSGNFMRGDTHPVREERLLRLKQELARWRRIQPRAIVAANG
ncbi:hypothetical protein BKA62DRAFT_624052 [Auriculariales sp. MPI-PUGE-AT-0066]|nr:hypothetical protein BKA62DRAFT_624052 [Auriculariales sp. MPI-PUGE-AT-0066]